ncbi:hypothetical protein [Singulisphaera sp. PoT]|uniref:hypothetical protein n=1 Tax=Singulisphaera sp. PoT TaxID=3411797 RepID=UPI003BF4AF1D
MGKYKGLLDDIKEKQAAGPQAAMEATPPSPAPLLPASEIPKATPSKRKPGRPKVGKSSNPEFVQTTAYVEEAVHIAVKKALLDVKDMDFSELVNDLLKKWVKSRM